MINTNTSLFNDFKPIRNMFRKLEVFDTLYVLKQYIDKFDNFGEKDKIQVANVESGEFAIIMPNVIDFYIVNCLLYSSTLRPEHSLADYKYRAKFTRAVTAFEQKVTDSLMSKDCFQWLRGFFYNQQKQTSGNYLATIYRYRTIYSDLNLSTRVEEIIGIPYKTFILNAAWLFSFFIVHHNSRLEKSQIINLDKKYANTDFTPENILKVLAVISKPLEEMRLLLKEYMLNRDNYFWLFSSPHIKFPIVEYDGYYYCVSTQYLLNQITSGMYYMADIPKANLTNEYGLSFENYVGHLLKKINIDNSYVIIPEITYGKDSKKTSDWIIINDTELVFVECKTKRIQIASLLQSSVDGMCNDHNNPLMDDLEIFAKGIIQLYKTHRDYCNNAVNNMPFDKNRKFFPVLVILEDFRYQLSLLDKELTEEIKKGLVKESIDPNILITNKYKIFSISEFETEVQLMMKVGFANYWSNKTENGTEIDNIYRENFKIINFYPSDYYNYFFKNIEP